MFYWSINTCFGAPKIIGHMQNENILCVLSMLRINSYEYHFWDNDENKFIWIPFLRQVMYIMMVSLQGSYGLGLMKFKYISRTFQGWNGEIQGCFSGTRSMPPEKRRDPRRDWHGDQRKIFMFRGPKFKNFCQNLRNWCSKSCFRRTKNDDKDEMPKFLFFHDLEFKIVKFLAK